MIRCSAQWLVRAREREKGQGESEWEREAQRTTFNANISVTVKRTAVTEIDGARTGRALPARVISRAYNARPRRIYVYRDILSYRVSASSIYRLFTSLEHFGHKRAAPTPFPALLSRLTLPFRSPVGRICKAESVLAYVRLCRARARASPCLIRSLTSERYQTGTTWRYSRTIIHVR